MTPPTESPKGAPRRRRNPRGQGVQLRDDLIEAAGALMAETGDPAAATIRAVARRAGVTAPSVYLHFDDREALVEAVLTRRFDDLAAAVRSAIDGLPASASPVEVVRAGCRGYVGWGLAHPGHYRALFGVTESVTREAGEAGGRALGLLVEGIADCQRAGAARSGDPFHLACLAWTAMHGMVVLRLLSPNFPWQPIDTMLDDALDGLLGLPAATA